MYTYLAILTLSGALLSAGLGVFTLTRNPRHPSNLGFALGMLALTLIGVGDTAVLVSPVSGGRGAALVGLRISLIGQALLPAAWFLFAVVFARANPRDILRRQLPVLAGLCLAALIFIIYSGSPGFVAFADAEGPAWTLPASGHALYNVGTVGRYFYIYLILSLVLCMVHLENTLRSSSGTKRWQIKYIIFGVGTILAFFIYLSSQSLLFSELGFETIPLTSSVVIISTAIMTVFIVRHRLMDVDIFISRYFIYNSMTVLVVGLYLIATGLVVQGIRYFQIPFNRFFSTVFVFVSILALMIILFTSTVRRKTKLFINRHFYKHKYEFRDKWMETTERISSKRSVTEIASTLRALVSETMGARKAYVWILDPANRCYTSVDSGLGEPERHINSTGRLIDRIREAGGPFIIENGGERPGDDGLNTLSEATGAVLCAPLDAGTELVGFILQGPDISGEPYMEDDFELLKAMTTQAAVQIKNIRLADDLLKVKEVDAFHQMSSFIMHDLKNLTNSLSLVSQNARDNIENPEFQKDAIRTLDRTVTRMKGLMDKLSALPREVELRREHVALKSLVHKAIQKIPVAEGLNLTILNEVGPAESVNVDPDAMDMVVLNLLKNAFEATGAGGRITVRSELNNGNVDLIISDNGVGMSPEYVRSSLFKPFKTTKAGGFGIGLFQCKTIVDAHGGKIEVQSTEGRGTTFKVTLPSAAKGGP